MPRGLNPYARAAWTRTIKQLRAQGDILPADVPAIERYVRTLAVARACWEQVSMEQLTATGSMGQPVTDPLVDSALKAEKHAAAFAKALGLEPEVRQPKNAGGRPLGSGGPQRPRSAEPPLVSPLRAVK